MSKKIDIRSLHKETKGTTTAPIIVAAPKNAVGIVKDDLSGVTSNEVSATAEELREYREFLTLHEVKDDDIQAVLDALITDGEVFWSFNILGKVPVTYRTRPTWTNMALLKELELQEAKTYMRFTNIVGLYNLAGSLVSFRDQKFTLDSQEDLQTTYEFVNGLSYVFQAKLIEKLALFDRLVTVATSDWAIKNFMEPQVEK